MRGGSDEAITWVRVSLESNLKIGQFSFTEQDLVIPVNGIPLTVARTCNSMNLRSADFGYSWTFNLAGMDVELDEKRSNVTIGSDKAPWKRSSLSISRFALTVSPTTGHECDCRSYAGQTTAEITEAIVILRSPCCKPG